jgi:hypothetical protein
VTEGCSEDYLIPKRGEIIGGWRKLHNEELGNLYCSPGIIRVIKSRRMRWARHVAHMGAKSNFGGKERRKETNRKS